jgi:hypothetical protein
MIYEPDFPKIIQETHCNPNALRAGTIDRRLREALHAPEIRSL